MLHQNQTRRKNSQASSKPHSDHPKPQTTPLQLQAWSCFGVTKKISLALGVRSLSWGSFVLAVIEKAEKKSLKLLTYRLFPLLTLSKSRALFSEKHHQKLFSLFSEWDKQDFLQSGMTQQHWGPQWFFALLSKQNYYSPGSRAAQTQVLHHLTPLWNIPWKWLSLSSAASSRLDTLQSSEGGVLSAGGMSTLCWPPHQPGELRFTLDMGQVRSAWGLFLSARWKKVLVEAELSSSSSPRDQTWGYFSDRPTGLPEN